MATKAQPQILQDVTDRVESTVKNIEKDLKDLQKRAERRRKTFERETDKRVKRFQKEFDKSPIVKRARAFQKDAQKRFDDGVDQVLGTLRIASQGDMAKLERKVTQLNRKVRELEKPAPRRKAS